MFTCQQNGPLSLHSKFTNDWGNYSTLTPILLSFGVNRGCDAFSLEFSQSYKLRDDGMG
jgi:hypothetical protein